MDTLNYGHVVRLGMVVAVPSPRRCIIGSVDSLVHEHLCLTRNLSGSECCDTDYPSAPKMPAGQYEPEFLRGNMLG
ncbi:hypothetical protein CSKR_201548 [Clonorchis sinensis]|uniref:Uncharacterized protein n=1 Tax=Clonorchis sinensis TaxID=79923 RepID=A0A8T1MRA9_CLOSI|nr:hypothetical protein CSKR_201548 [Clonorchis sinensis]